MCFKNNYGQNWFFFSPNWYLFLVEASVLGLENLKYKKMHLESGQKNHAYLALTDNETSLNHQAGCS